MNIGVISSREHLRLAKIMISSIEDNCQENIDLYLFHVDLTKKELEILESEKVHVNSIIIDSKIFDGITVTKHFGLFSYFRLLAPYLLPKEIDRIMWLDTDLIIKKDISNYYHTDFKDNCLIASPSFMSKNGGGLNTYLIDKYKINSSYIYFNAGVLVMNLKKMREFISLESVLKIVYDDRDYLEYIDQDVLNLLYWDKCLITSQYLYNFAPKDARVDSNININSMKKAFIVHYCGELKPTNPRYRELGFRLYWKYAKKYDYCAYFRTSIFHFIYVVGRIIKKIFKS